MCLYSVIYEVLHACCSFRPRYLIDEYSYFLSELGVFLKPIFHSWFKHTRQDTILSCVVHYHIAPWRYR